MTAALLYDVIESPTHPDLGTLARRLGLERVTFTNQRKAIAQLKRRPPGIVAADFFYGYGNNYAGANVSNLDVLLRSLQRFAPDARVVVFADQRELPHVPRLAELFELHAVIAVPCDDTALQRALRPD
jgi:hypothetical protein